MANIAIRKNIVGSARNKLAGFLLKAAKRWEPARIVLANREWDRELQRLQAVPPEDYPNAWGAARRRLYGKYGPLPCPPQEVRRLRSLHNRYVGQRIFIMGSGPSLNQTPLEKLAGEYTFGLNRVYLLFERIEWRPTFYTTLDWRVAPDNAAEINSLRGMTFFFPQRFRGLLRTGEDIYWYWSKNRGTTLDTQFSYDASAGLYGGNTVTVTAIQLAYYMGFDPIYLIGCDTDYKIPPTVKQSGPDYFKQGVKLYLESTRNDDPNHFDPYYFGAGKKWHDPNVAGMIEGYASAKAALKARGRRIYNATIGGKLEIFERVPFNSLF